MDIIYNRLKKQVETSHGEFTFDKLGAVIVTCMEFSEHSVGELTGEEKESWVVDAVDKLWYDQNEKHLVSKKKKISSDGTSGDIEDLIRQLIRQVCVASKGKVIINTPQPINQKKKEKSDTSLFGKRKN